MVTAHFRSNRVPALLGYLALRPGVEVRREEIADALWPNLHAEAARNNLRVTLSYLKPVLEMHGLDRGLVAPDRATLLADGEVLRADTALFGELERQGSAARLETLEEALALASAPLLSGLSDDWIEPFRAAAARARVAMRTRCAELLAPTDPAGAIEHARRAIAEDPLAAAPHALAAEASLRLGDPAAAIRDLVAYRDALRETGGELPANLERILAQARRAGATRNAPRVPPRPRTRFYGREAELAEVFAWIERGEDRLLTVCGPGGMGKSRLGAEVVARLEEGSAVRWVDATGIASGAALLDLVATSLASGEAAPGRSLDRIAAALGAEPTLLVLDNLESVPDGEMVAVDEILDAAPQTLALCLSRKTLGLPGERVLRLGPLPLPVSTDDRSAPALCLFLDRAEGLEEGEVDSDLLALAQELEGIPLAIELAAAKTSNLTVRELLDGMQARLDVLVARNARLPRHRAMRTTLDWSFDLLTPVVRDAILGFAVLRNGWNLAAANALTELEDLAVTRDVLEIACANSLLTHVTLDRQSRYGMLECTREYALETLPPSRRERLRARHATFYGELARRGKEGGEGDEANFQAALEFLAEEPEQIEALLDLCEARVAVWAETGAGRSALRTIEAIDRLPLSPPDRARIELYEVWLRIAISDFEAGLAAADRGLAESPERVVRARLLSARTRLLRIFGRMDEAAQSAREAVESAQGGPPAVLAEALCGKGAVEVLQLDPAGRESCLQAAYYAEQGNDPVVLARALDALRITHFRAGDLDGAEAALVRLEAVPLPLTAGRRALFQIGRGQIAVMRGRLAAARDAFAAAVESSRAAAHPWYLCQSLAQLGDTETKLGRFAEAWAAHEEVCAIRRRSGERSGLASGLRGLGMAAYGLGDPERAVLEMTEARKLAESARDDFFLMTLLVPLMKAAHAAGRSEEAREAAEAAIATGERLAQTPELSRELDLAAIVAEAQAYLDSALKRGGD